MRSLSDYLIPDLIAPSVEAIPFDRFYREGIRLLIFDIDNTLVSYETPDPTCEVIELMGRLSAMGFRIAFVSNNTPERVERFNRPFSFPAFPDAHKPLRRAIAPVLKECRFSPSETLVIGDQLLTDVLAAKLHGIRAVTVPPVEKNESRFFRFKRRLEAPFVRAYWRRKKKKREENKEK